MYINIFTLILFGYENSKIEHLQRAKNDNVQKKIERKFLMRLICPLSTVEQKQ